MDVVAQVQHHQQCAANVASNDERRPLTCMTLQTTRSAKGVGAVPNAQSAGRAMVPIAALHLHETILCIGHVT